MASTCSPASAGIESGSHLPAKSSWGASPTAITRPRARWLSTRRSSESITLIAAKYKSLRAWALRSFKLARPQTDALIGTGRSVRGERSA